MKTTKNVSKQAARGEQADGGASMNASLTVQKHGRSMVDTEQPPLADHQVDMLVEEAMNERVVGGKKDDEAERFQLQNEEDTLEPAQPMQIQSSLDAVWPPYRQHDRTVEESKQSFEAHAGLNDDERSSAAIKPIGKVKGFPNHSLAPTMAPGVKEAPRGSGFFSRAEKDEQLGIQNDSHIPENMKASTAMDESEDAHQFQTGVDTQTAVEQDKLEARWPNE